MIVTPNLESRNGHVVLQRDHTDLAWQVLTAFGNQDFEAPTPKDEVDFVVLNHDRGWDMIDAEMPVDPTTLLPYSLDQTPVDLLLSTTTRSVDFNKNHHPYCGLLAGMHIWGLYHGRFGISDHVVIDTLSRDARIKTEQTLSGIKRRYDELRIMLELDAAFSPYVEAAKLMQNYRLLQFCDMLSLYCNFSVGKAGDPVSFAYVPNSCELTSRVSLTPLGGKKYRLEPYPFCHSEEEMCLKSHRVREQIKDAAYTVDPDPTLESIVFVR